jgi:hypothetical protein
MPYIPLHQVPAQHGFELVIRFIAHLHVELITTLPHTHRLVFWVCYSIHQLFVGSSFQRRTYPLLWVLELSLWLSYQSLTMVALNNWIATTNSLDCIVLNCTALAQSSHIASEWIHRELHFQQVFYCCMTPLRTWCLPLLHVYVPLTTCYFIYNIIQECNPHVKQGTIV